MYVGWPGRVLTMRAVTPDTREALDPGTPAWTWGHRQDVGFTSRRVAQETAVHCWDALTAIDCSEPIDRTLAVDGIDEFLDEVLPCLSTDLAGRKPSVCTPATAGTRGLSALETVPSHLFERPGRPKSQWPPPHPTYCCSYGAAAHSIKYTSTATSLRCNASWPEQRSSSRCAPGAAVPGTARRTR